MSTDVQIRPALKRTTAQVASVREEKAATTAKLTQLRRQIRSSTSHLRPTIKVKRATHIAGTPFDIGREASDPTVIHYRTIYPDETNHVHLIVYRVAKKTKISFGLHIEKADTVITIADETVASWIIPDDEHYSDSDVLKLRAVASNMERFVLSQL